MSTMGVEQGGTVVQVRADEIQPGDLWHEHGGKVSQVAEVLRLKPWDGYAHIRLAHPGRGWVPLKRDSRHVVTRGVVTVHRRVTVTFVFDTDAQPEEVAGMIANAGLQFSEPVDTQGNSASWSTWDRDVNVWTEHVR